MEEVEDILLWTYAADRYGSYVYVWLGGNPYDTLRSDPRTWLMRAVFKLFVHGKQVYGDFDTPHVNMTETECRVFKLLMKTVKRKKYKLWREVCEDTRWSKVCGDKRRKREEILLELEKRLKTELMLMKLEGGE